MNRIPEGVEVSSSGTKVVEEDFRNSLGDIYVTSWATELRRILSEREAFTNNTAG
ncbi:hypothetical protein E4U14_007609 [Claviceps sp. LM454 group G7]|nr:hypothetical protein E4U14_007609 [Claviceps sp. LM454 group G7]